MGNAPELTVNAAAAGSSKGRTLPRTKIIKVDGAIISRDAIARETQNHPSSTPLEAWTSAARALVVRELLLQEVRRRGIVAAPITDAEGRRETDDEAAIRLLIDTVVATPEPDDDTCRRVYDANVSRFRSSDLSEVRHILIAAAPRDEAARADARRRAQCLIDELSLQPSLFADLAASHSQCPSAATGGSLGQITDGQTVPEFERAIAEAPAGAVMPTPVESRYGFHVVSVDRRVPGNQLPFEIARPQIAAWLVAKSRHIGIRAFISDLARVAKIEGFELDLDAG